MPSAQALYRCTSCWRAVQRVCDIGPRRRMWCGRCAASCTFARVTDRLRAASWPPKPRKGEKERGSEGVRHEGSDPESPPYSLTPFLPSSLTPLLPSPSPSPEDTP
jgi:hypothetical protein